MIAYNFAVFILACQSLPLETSLESITDQLLLAESGVMGQYWDAEESMVEQNENKSGTGEI